MNLGTFIDKLQSIEDTDGFCNAEVYFTSVDEKPCLIIQGRDDMYCFNLLNLNDNEIETNDFSNFMNSREHIRLSINIETGELQRHIYATGQWFGDFDRVLCENWINEEDYQKFIDRVIEVYNSEFKGVMWND